MTNSFQRVSDMNVAFGNPKGDYNNIDWEDITNQCLNIADEFFELLKALGAHPTRLEELQADVAAGLKKIIYTDDCVDILGVRDALCDIQVFAMGAQHKMGVNGDDDMRSVVEGVMTRFIKSDEDLEATLVKHYVDLGKDVALEGIYPTAILRSIKDGPDRPKGKFLKSASFAEPKFTDPVLADYIRRIPGWHPDIQWAMLNEVELIDHGVCEYAGEIPVKESFVAKNSSGQHLAYIVPV